MARTISRRSGMFVLVAALAATSAEGWSGCGVSFELPRGWNAEVICRDKIACEIGLRPRGWQAMMDKSRWYEERYAIRLLVYHTTLQAAARDLGFETDEQGQWGVRGRMGDMSVAQPVTFGAFRGWRSEPWFRGFAHDGADLRNTSRIYSGSRIILLLRDRHGTIVGIRYNQWSPDIDVDRDAATAIIARSMAHVAQRR